MNTKTIRTVATVNQEAVDAYMAAWNGANPSPGRYRPVVIPTKTLGWFEVDGKLVTKTKLVEWTKNLAAHAAGRA